MSSFSFSSNHIDYNQSLQNAQPASSHHPNRQYSPQHSPKPQLQRRESLVKPTWQNVCPGEVPFDTLEKLNKLSNGEQQQILQQYNQPLQQYQQQLHQQQQHHYQQNNYINEQPPSDPNSVHSNGKFGDATAGHLVNSSGHSTSSIGPNNNNQITSKAGNKQRRQVDLFDIAGKVKLSIYFMIWGACV